MKSSRIDPNHIKSDKGSCNQGPFFVRIFGTDLMWRNGFYIALLCMMGFVQGCSNPCRTQACENDGFCHEGECICQKWYSGEHCELKFNRNYAGKYFGRMVVENGMALRTNDTIELLAAYEPNVLITSMGFDVVFDSDSSIIIAPQVVSTSDASYEVEGSGKYEVDYIELDYSWLNRDTDQIQRVRFEGSRIEKD